MIEGLPVNIQVELSSYSTEHMKAELSRREKLKTIHICSVCHKPCGAGGCHGDGFNLKISKFLAEQIADIDFSDRGEP